MSQGKVKWFDSRKGYGFIETDEGNDLFVHYSEIKSETDSYRSLDEGDLVEFEVKDGPKGAQATNVVKR